MDYSSRLVVGVCGGVCVGGGGGGSAKRGGRAPAPSAINVPQAAGSGVWAKVAATLNSHDHAFQTGIT